MPARELLPGAVIGILRREKEAQSTRRAQKKDAILAAQRTLGQRVAISYPIINRQPLSIQPVERKHFIPSASVVAGPKVER
jgi:hypothetical protein